MEHVLAWGNEVTCWTRPVVELDPSKLHPPRSGFVQQIFINSNYWINLPISCCHFVEYRGKGTSLLRRCASNILRTKETGWLRCARMFACEKNSRPYASPPQWLKTWEMKSGQIMCCKTRQKIFVADTLMLTKSRIYEQKKIWQFHQSAYNSLLRFIFWVVSSVGRASDS